MAQYEHLLEKRLLPRFGSRRISAIVVEDVEKWIGDMVAEGLAPNSVHNYYVLPNKTLRYALRHRLIPFNPADGVELPKNVRSEGFAPVFLTAKQVEALAAEIAGLRVRDINLAAGHVEVRQTMKRIGKEWKVGTPKSARSTRNVPLVQSGLKTELRMLLLAHPNSGDPDALFWPGRHAHSHALDYSQPVNLGAVLRYYLRPAAERVSIPPRIRFHDLRHTFASLMLAAGFKPYEVSRWMEHASVSTTDGIYGHLYPTDYNEQITKFEAFVAEA